MDFDDDEAIMESDDEDETPNHSGEDDDGIAMEPTHNTNADGKDKDFEYSVLAPDEIVQEMCTMIKDVAAVVQIQPTTCRILLHHFKWNKESLLERFYDAADPEKFFREAHVVSPFVRQAKPREHLDSPRVVHCPTEETCLICFLTLPTSSLTGLECGHQFCRMCWDLYLTMNVMEEERGQSIPCPEHKCDILVDDTKAMELIRDENVRRRYQLLIANSFVECNRLLKWCPGTDCGRAIKVQHYDVRPVTCACGITFCFTCGLEWHAPVNCRLLELWTKKCGDDSETSNLARPRQLPPAKLETKKSGGDSETSKWISANTKKCPKCQATIEKDGGCNHMTCKNTGCTMEFCWMCLGPWEMQGSWHYCNRFDDSAARSARNPQERSQAASERYLHYYNRFMNHQQSLRLENKLYATMMTKMELMQRQNMSWIEVQFLKKAVDILSDCRRTLMYTYAFAFYLEKNNQSEIFEGNQRDLERATEQLSEFLERDLDSENLVPLKQKVQDKYRYVEQRHAVLLKHCSEGTEKSWWHYTD